MTTFNPTLIFYLLLLIVQDLQEDLKEDKDSKNKVKSILYFNHQFNQILIEVFNQTQNRFLSEDFSDGISSCRFLLQDGILIIENEITTQLFNDFILALFKDVPNVYPYQILNLYSHIIKQNCEFFSGGIDLITDVKIRVQY